MNIRETLKRALADREIASSPSAYRNERLTRVVEELAENEYTSEWLHTVGKPHIEFHAHSESDGRNLKHLYDQGVRAGNPRLAGVYSRSDLKEVIRADSAAYT